MPQIEVTFDIDANGILNVSAKDKASSKEQSIRIEASSGLSDSEIDRMVGDAAEHSAEDKKRREEIEVRNQADQQVYQTEKQLSEMGDKVNAESKSKVEAAVGRVKEALKGTSSEEIKSATEALTQAWHQVAGELYQQASAEAGPQPGSQPGPEAGPAPGSAHEKKKDEKAVDADFEVVDDKE